MKVVQINAVCDIGSTGQICRELNDALVCSGHEGIILYGNGRSQYPLAERISGSLEVKAHGFLSRLLGKNAAYSPVATGKLLRMLRDYQPDVVHLHNLHGNYVNVKPLLKFLAEKDIPTVLTLHDCWFFTGKCTHYTEANCNKWQTGCRDCPKLRADIPAWFFDRTAQMWAEKQSLFRRISRLAVIGVSDWITREAESSFLQEAAVLQRIYNWIDLDVFFPRGKSGRSRFGISEGKYAVLCVAARWDDRSGKTGDLLELARRLPEAYELILAGAVPFAKRLPDNIKPVGYLSAAEDMAKLYSACDVCVHLSREDTFGKVVAEAVACGTPVVVYDSTACPETAGSHCGEIVPAGDVAAVLHAIRRILSREPAQWEEICVEYARNRFSKDVLITQTLELYQKMAAQEG